MRLFNCQSNKAKLIPIKVLCVRQFPSLPSFFISLIIFLNIPRFFFAFPPRRGRESQGYFRVEEHKNKLRNQYFPSFNNYTDAGFLCKIYNSYSGYAKVLFRPPLALYQACLGCLNDMANQYRSCHSSDPAGYRCDGCYNGLDL